MDNNTFTSITIATGIYPPDIGGPASFIPIFANLLTEKGIKVTVITLSDMQHDDSYLPYKVIRINRKIKKPFRDILVIAEIVKSAKKSNLIFSNTLAFESVIASKITGKKIIQKVVGDIAWERASVSGRFNGTLDEYQKEVLDIKSKLTNLYRNFSIRNSDMIITPSYYLQKVVNGWEYPKENIEVIYNAVEFKQNSRSIKKHKFRIISVCRLIPHKGVEVILRALSKLEFEFEYILIGSGPLKSGLEKLSNNLNIDTKFIGDTSKKEVANWLRSSDIFILNSSYEGLPHIVLEAMENDCPVVASRVGGTPEIVEDNKNGLLFKYNDIDDLLKKINLIKENSSLRFFIVNNGKIFTRKFADVEKMVDKYIKAIRELV